MELKLNVMITATVEGDANSINNVEIELLEHCLEQALLSSDFGSDHEVSACHIAINITN